MSQLYESHYCKGMAPPTIGSALPWSLADCQYCTADDYPPTPERQLAKAREELAENEGVMRALRRQRDTAEYKLAEVRATANYWTSSDPADPRLPQALRQGGRTILAILDREDA